MYIYKNVDVGRWVGMLESAEGDWNIDLRLKIRQKNVIFSRSCYSLQGFANSSG